MKIIGLTGGISTGKSTVARMMTELGAEVLDADLLARDAVAPGTESLDCLVGIFGREILLPDGSLDRQAVRSKVFADAAKLQQLESVLHPAIKRLAFERLEKIRKSGSEVAVYMAPLLIEAGATDRVDEVWVVTVSPDIQLQRLMNRDGCGPEEAQRIIAAQMPLEEKASFGVVVIDNSGTPAETRRQVIEAWEMRVSK